MSEVDYISNVGSDVMVYVVTLLGFLFSVFKIFTFMGILEVQYFENKQLRVF